MKTSNIVTYTVLICRLHDMKLCLLPPPPLHKMKLCIFAKCAKQECASLSRMRTKMSIFCYLRKTNLCMYSKCAHFVCVFRKHTMSLQFITSEIRKPKSKNYIILGAGGCRCIDLFVWWSWPRPEESLATVLLTAVLRPQRNSSLLHDIPHDCSIR
jgi:hypothetical protein